MTDEDFHAAGAAASFNEEQKGGLDLGKG